jgi:hypothetical protein
MDIDPRSAFFSHFQDPFATKYYVQMSRAENVRCIFFWDQSDAWEVWRFNSSLTLCHVDTQDLQGKHPRKFESLAIPQWDSQISKLGFINMNKWSSQNAVTDVFTLHTRQASPSCSGMWVTIREILLNPFNWDYKVLQSLYNLYANNVI